MLTGALTSTVTPQLEVGYTFDLTSQVQTAIFGTLHSPVQVPPPALQFDNFFLIFFKEFSISFYK